MDMDYSELLEQAPKNKPSGTVKISIRITPGALFGWGFVLGAILMAIPLIYFARRSDSVGRSFGSQDTAARVVLAAAPTTQPGGGVTSGSCGSGGCGCGGGNAGNDIQPRVGEVQTVTVADGQSVQLLESVYTFTEDMAPNTFAVKKGKPVRLELAVRDDGRGCMSTFTIPGLSDQVEELRAGQKIVREFTPQSVGEYEITCAMGIPRGTIKVI